MNEETLFEESLSFIKDNLDVTFAVVPRYLRDFWMLKADSNPSDPSATKQWSVFMFALLAHKKSKNIMEFRISEDEFFELFDSWQIILSLAEINEKTDIAIKPIKLFDFDELGSEVEMIMKNVVGVTPK